MKDVIIIGGGLCGLALAYILKKQGLNLLVLEGRNRLGGRVLTISKNQVQVEMGATWIHPQHTTLLRLLKDLNLEVYEQHMGSTAFYEPVPNSPHQLVPLPLQQEPSYRIKGGSSQLINTLENQLEQTDLVYNCSVIKIENEGGHININSSKGQYSAKQVVSTLPPFLFHKTIETKPSLPNELNEILGQTHTWMGESIKIALTYSAPFWLRDSTSGTIFSNSGPITEMYDHTTFKQDTFSLKGFLNPAFDAVSKEDRLQAILIQLKRYYGEIANSYLSYDELIWKHESLTSYGNDKALFPHQNNGHQLFRSSCWNERLFIAGSETASSFPGYMEGAIISAQETAQKIEHYLARSGFSS